MTLFFRLLGVLWNAWRRPKLGLTETSEVALHVWPNDEDLYGHVNNGRYLTLMDLGRVDLITRTGLGRIAGKNRWNPLVAAVHIRFRKSLKKFQKFTLKTRLVWWDEKWLYLEQCFEKDGQIVAEAMVQCLFRGAHTSVPTDELFRTLGASAERPSMPPAVRNFLE